METDKLPVYAGWSQIVVALYESELRDVTHSILFVDQNERPLTKPLLVRAGRDCEGNWGQDFWNADAVARRMGYRNGEFVFSRALSPGLQDLRSGVRVGIVLREKMEVDA